MQGADTAMVSNRIPITFGTRRFGRADAVCRLSCSLLTQAVGRTRSTRHFGLANATLSSYSVHAEFRFRIATVLQSSQTSVQFLAISDT